MLSIVLAALVASTASAGSPELLQPAAPYTPVVSARSTSGTDPSTRGSGRSRNTVSVTLRPVAALGGRADLQVEARFSKNLSFVGHGVKGTTAEVTTSTQNMQGEVSEHVQIPAERVGAGVGVKYSFRNFNRGAFVGFDVDVNEDTHGKYGTSRIMRAIPRVGWKLTGDRGLTFCADLGVGYRKVTADSKAVEQMVIPGPVGVRVGSRLGWSF